MTNRSDESRNTVEGREGTGRLSRKAVLGLVFALCAVGCLVILATGGVRVWYVAQTYNRISGAFVVSVFLAFVFAWLAATDIRRAPEQILGRALVHATVLLSAGMFGFFVYANYRTLNSSGPHAKGSRVRSDMRSLATAIDAYFVDHGQYPVWSIGGRRSVAPSYNHWVAEMQQRRKDPANLPSFALPADGVPYRALTTPLAYVITYPGDPFAPLKGVTFVYWSVGSGETDPSGTITGTETDFGWIVVSPGYDGVYTIPPDYDVYDPRIPQPSDRLIAGTNRRGEAYTYDPTNGVMSDGDIWRVKQ